MSRNKNRMGSHRPENVEAPPQASPLNFVTPTEFVELPSQGKGYADDHPLYNEDTVEIRFMTAKDEDILTSHTLLKKGLAVDRFIQNIIVDKRIKPEHLLIGDKNAILIAARVSGYGSTYEATVTCGNCDTNNRISFDLTDTILTGNEVHEDLKMSRNSDGTFNVTLPFTKYTVTVRLLTGADETYLAQYMTNSRKNKMPENLMTSQFKRMITSVEGYTDRAVLDEFIENMPTADSRHIRFVNRLITPNIEIKKTLECQECDHEQEVDVPFGTDFFWPDR